MFGLLDCVPYDGDCVMVEFVVLGFSSIHFTVTLGRLKNVICFGRNFVILGFITLGSLYQFLYNRIIII